MSLADEYNNAKSDQTVNSIEKLLKNNGLSIDDIGKVSKVSLSNNPDDTKIILSPKWSEGPEWQPVQHAEPVVIQPKVRTPALISSDWKVAVALPDPQIGYRKYEDGTVDPFHDEAAMDVALQVVGLDHGHPLDQIINLCMVPMTRRQTLHTLLNLLLIVVTVFSLSSAVMEARTHESFYLKATMISVSIGLLITMLLLLTA
jgi:hypothetical protein